LKFLTGVAYNGLSRERLLKKKRKQVSQKEKARRAEQRFRDSGGHHLDDGAGGSIRATPRHKGKAYELGI
jgi:hypothetical protein